jgi:tight adherence protein B
VTAPLLAALAAVAAVFGAWDALTVIEQARPAAALGRVVAPLRLAGRAGRPPTTAERRRLATLGAATLLAAGWLLAGPLLGFLLAASGPAAIGQLLAARHRRWHRALAESAPTVARALADALSGGHSLRGALEEIGRPGTLPGPAGIELAAAARRLTLGAPTEDVLTDLRTRAADPAWDTLIAATLLQRDTGGDLATLLRSIATSREHARRIEADAHTTTAQARATARLVASMPLAALALTELITPGTLIALLTDPIARLLLLSGLILAAASFLTISRIARLGET